MTTQKEAMAAKVKQEAGAVVKEEGDQELGSPWSVADMVAAPRTRVHEVVPWSTPQRSSRCFGCLGPLERRYVLCTPRCSGAPERAHHLAVRVAAHIAGCHLALEAPWYLGVGGVPGGG